MLKNISPILSPELLKVLMEMGHGDELVLGDGNFPSASVAQRLLRADGHGVPELLDAILKLFPLDQYVECPVALMDNGDSNKRPEIWAEYKSIVENNESGKKIELVERFAFYERSKK
ncbi:MAG: RbsD/FucU domain-containing protein, partial [Eubacteriales bacterium]